jgi:hypothetical protein
VPYELVRTVQELNALLHRYSVTPEAGQLLSAQPQRIGGLPPSLTDFAAIEELLRGAGCLLANGFAQPAVPVLLEAVRQTRRLDAALSGRLATAVGSYYELVEAELAAGSQTRAERGHWLCGEAIALYLDVLATVRESPELRADTKRLRGALQLGRAG